MVMQMAMLSQEVEYSCPRKAIISTTDPNQEVYLVVRIEKVLQGSIGSCVEAYLKSGDTKKASQKAHKLAEICCKSLGLYGMPFGWTARPLFNTEGGLDSSEISSIYKQDSDDEMIKLLTNYSVTKDEVSDLIRDYNKQLMDSFKDSLAQSVG
ncbi:dedicator of cytokinesis protein 9-like [Montipora foliosa]|uniref:dedicator of cytokinesis protein 9-like n=1 Tax=Montipora foliosa TaxID=591990 RepID=UPI0035F1931A